MDQEPNAYCLSSSYTDKNVFKITLKFLEKLWEKAVKEKKLPRFSLGLKRNDKEMFVLDCKISLEKKGSK